MRRRSRSIRAAIGRTHDSASGTRRSLPPFPSRTTISRRSRSTSFTRMRRHSVTRSPPPYISPTTEPEGFLELLQDGAHLAMTEHDGQPAWSARRRDAIHARERAPDDVRVEEDERRQRLILGRRRTPALPRQDGEEASTSSPRLRGMPPPVRHDEPPDPVDVCRLGPRAYRRSRRRRRTTSISRKRRSGSGGPVRWESGIGGTGDTRRSREESVKPFLPRGGSPHRFAPSATETAPDYSQRRTAALYGKYSAGNRASR